MAWYIGLPEEAIRKRVAETARGFLGIQEGTVEHNELVLAYNSQGKLPRGYALKATDPWCAAFVSVVGITLGISNIILPEVGCGEMINLYRKAGRWEEDDAYVPDVGDLVMYDWSAVKGECLGAPDHVGMVIGRNGKTLLIIEGNYDNRVKVREICVEYIKVRGYCCPDYGALVQAFADVPNDAWYAEAVAKAAQLGIMTGVGDQRFEPDRAVTRGELAAVAVRLAELAAK